MLWARASCSSGVIAGSYICWTPPAPSTLDNDRVTSWRRSGRRPAAPRVRRAGRPRRAGRRRLRCRTGWPRALDDGDVGVRDVVLDLLAHLLQGPAGLGEQIGDGDAADRRRGPQQHLRGAVLAHHQGLHIAWPGLEPVGELDTEPQAVDQRAREEHPVVSGQLQCEVRQRIGRIGDHHQHRLRRDGDDLRDDVRVHLGVGLQQPQPALWVGAIGCTAGLLVHPRGDHDDSGVRQVVVASAAHIDRGGQRCGVPHVGATPAARALSRSITTISRHVPPRSTSDSMVADPTAPTPMAPTFIAPPLLPGGPAAVTAAQGPRPPRSCRPGR